MDNGPLINLTRIDTIPADGNVVQRLIGDNGELVMQFVMTPMDAVNVARNMMEKAAEAVVQPAPDSRDHGALSALTGLIKHWRK